MAQQKEVFTMWRSCLWHWFKLMIALPQRYFNLILTIAHFSLDTDKCSGLLTNKQKNACSKKPWGLGGVLQSICKSLSSVQCDGVTVQLVSLHCDFSGSESASGWRHISPKTQHVFQLLLLWQTFVHLFALQKVDLWESDSRSQMVKGHKNSQDEQKGMLVVLRFGQIANAFTLQRNT